MKIKYRRKDETWKDQTKTIDFADRKETSKEFCSILITLDQIIGGMYKSLYHRN